MEPADIIDAARSMPPPPDNLSGQAFVTMSNPEYNRGTYVLARMIQHVGCNDLLHVWHWRDAPPAEYLRRQPNVVLRELDAIPYIDKKMRVDSVRSALLLHCGLERAFWIGSDAYPVTDPTQCFNDLQYGGVWWREVPEGDKFYPGNYGLPESARHETYQIQGDTIVLDLTQENVYKAVGLTHFFNLNYHIFDRAHEAHGDQTQYRAAWAIFGMKQFFYTLDRVDWQSFPMIYLHQGRDGKTPMIVHRVGSKWPSTREWNGPLVYHRALPLEEIAHGYYRQVGP